MAKGAKKKTKWVSLSLASTTAGTVPAAEHHEAASESSRGTKKSAYSAPNLDRSSCSENAPSNVAFVERKSPWNTNNGYFRSQSTDESNGQTYPNGYRTHPSRNYSAHFKSHYNKSSYYHNGSRRPHYSSYNDRSRSNNVNEPKSEQNGAVIINEEEYTKITTPRQDVLFKKGYLSRPKKHTTTSTTSANESGTATGSSSVNGTTTDGSDAALGSGTVSTAESVTSDSTYLTDGHLLDYPAPLPYFGYIDPSGVLVMNGFAVDNSGYPYMNGGQTYIYPPNYHCPSTFNEDAQTGDAEEEDPAASIGDQIQSSESFNGISESAVQGLQDTVDSDIMFNSISEETVEALVSENDGADSNQQVPQQSMLSPLDSSYDLAQYYNNFYYGCMLTPFPVVNGDMYYDQFGGVSEEEQVREQSFRRRKKRYRNLDEYPPTFYPDGTVDTMYQYSNVSNISENGMPNPTEVPVDFVAFESTSNDRTVPTLPPITENIDTTNQTTSELPSSHQADQCASPSRSSKPANPAKVEDRSPPSAVSQSSGKPRSHVQKTRKKDLIEMTRAFAEQNIDLSRPVSLYKSPEDKTSEASEWKTVRNGKEVAIKDDREVSVRDTIKKSKEDSEPVKTEKLFFDDCKPDQSVVSGVSDETRRSKKEATSKKGKKTAKGKGKKQKRQAVANHQTGFEVIEPEFIVDKKDLSQARNEEPIAVYDEDLDEDDTEVHAEINVELEEVQNLNLNEVEPISSTSVIEHDVDDDDEECLENDLHGIQLSDLQLEEGNQEDESSQKEVEEQEIIDPVSQESEIVNISEEIIEEHTMPQIEENVEVHENIEVQEVLSDSKEVNTIEGTTPNQASAEDINLIETVLPLESTSLVQLEDHELGVEEEEEQKCKHFSMDEYSEEFDSGVQSPAAFTSSSSDSKDRKSSSSSFGSQDIHLTDAVTKWLSETLSNKRLEEMFVLPEDPLLLHRIHQFNVLNFDESLVVSSDTYSSSSEDDAEDSVDSDYMSDVQVKKRELNGGPEGQQKTELKKDQLAKQTANGHHRLMNGGDHSNHKQKRCIIM
ncbi:uncharacterized protein LOC109407553 [Aedes albopictus]|uniref:Uncharacterized protein n=1 Tax=Aedes albopictus TaxID=7160 RepID=A0ABM1Y5V9_AEDAL|nr:uncharacterized protein LOC109407553 [Aedes albopictus]XP_029720422.1 uncharacterized protein LOC109407553 [Aedes albopictus]XP_029720423.1 uncharacterized protein LOC109407553 [Aedes albopictus]